jgi:hypothetical protein
MACGCKKKSGTQSTTTEGTNINTQISLENVLSPNETITLTAEQQKQIDEIAEKIKKIS